MRCCLGAEPRELAPRNATAMRFRLIERLRKESSECASDRSILFFCRQKSASFASAGWCETPCVRAEEKIEVRALTTTSVKNALSFLAPRYAQPHLPLALCLLLRFRCDDTYAAPVLGGYASMLFGFIYAEPRNLLFLNPRAFRSTSADSACRCARHNL